MVQHPDLELSLYLDDALPLEERRQVDAHLAGCDDCRTRLAELRGVTQLVAALPQRSPRRSLLPQRARLPGWLVPARWASTLATAVFVIAFVASNLPSVSTQSASPALATGPSSNADQAAGGSKEASPTPGPAYQPGFSIAPTPPADALRNAATGSDRATVQPRGSAPSEPVARSFSTEVAQAPSWLWLIPAALFAAIALGLQWRIRQVR